MLSLITYVTVQKLCIFNLLLFSKSISFGFSISLGVNYSEIFHVSLIGTLLKMEEHPLVCYGDHHVS